MGDPQRLLESGNEVQRLLLASTEKDKVMPRGVKSALLASAAIPGGGGFAVRPLSHAKSIPWVKWFAGGILGVSVAGAIVYRSTSGTRVDAVLPSDKGVVASGGDVTPSVAAAASSPIPTSSTTTDEAKVPTSPSRHGDSMTVSPTSPASTSSLDAQARIIEQARTLLRGGNAQQALTVLRSYDAKYPKGALAEEASALSVDALHRSGDDAGAARRGRNFLRLYPASPYASRVRSVVQSVVPAP